MSDNRVTMSAEAWARVEAAILDLPYRVAAPIVDVIRQTGGVVAVPKEESDDEDGNDG